MALNSHSQLILLHINSQTWQPKVFDLVNTTTSSKGTEAATTVSSCLVSADKTFKCFSHGLCMTSRQNASFPPFANFHGIVVADVCTALQGIE